MGKRCARCLTIKPRAKFNSHKGRKDGLQAYCKQCQSAIYKDRRESHLEINRKYCLKHKDRIREYKRKWAADRCKDEDAQVKMAARSAVRNAVRRGEIKKPKKCFDCGEVKRLEQHHFLGYAEENHFDIVWLCKRCHESKHSRGRY